MDILTEIINKRKELIKRTGFTMGASLPKKRIAPLNTFVKDPFLICEVKRKSPSKGNISIGLDAQKQAELYFSKGVKSISVLTEPNYFAGSLSDLILVKQSFPDLAVLRKDFLLSIEDIEVSYTAGADAVLLIASILTKNEIEAMYKRTKELGMEALVEVHDKEDIDKVKEIKPVLIGINSRNLSSFLVDLTIPLSMKQMITWDTNLLFESGIHSQEDAMVALGSGFRGMLVGEAVVRDPSLIDALLSAYSLEKHDFWEKLYKRKKPFVKICGITNKEDAYHAQKYGADILGFIFAPSKRKADTSLLYDLKDCDILKVGVVVTQGHTLDPEVKELLDTGLIDAIQFHGDEEPERCYSTGFPYYKALRIKNEQDIDTIKNYNSPRVLIDAFSETGHGGTGKIIPEHLISLAKEILPLWLAGGLGPENVSTFIEKFSPELIDASTKLEQSPGKKDHERVARFIKLIKE